MSYDDLRIEVEKRVFYLLKRVPFEILLGQIFIILLFVSSNPGSGHKNVSKNFSKQTLFSFLTYIECS